MGFICLWNICVRSDTTLDAQHFVIITLQCTYVQCIFKDREEEEKKRDKIAP